jgi:putative SOS response-associated peptidase YedK
MCGRYTYYSSEEIIAEYELLPKKSKQLALDLKIPDNYNVAPGMQMPVIVRGEQEHQIEMMLWGLIPAWSETEHTKLKLINARKEKLFKKKSMWLRLVKNKRCIVPARGFYEWKEVDKDKFPMYITPTIGMVFSFAGLWDEWTNKQTGEILTSYTIITTTPNKEMSDIHTRMPVILTKEQADVWLAPGELSQDLVYDLLKPAPDGSLNIVQVGKDVNSTRNNFEKLIYPLEEE